MNQTLEATPDITVDEQMDERLEALEAELAPTMAAALAPVSADRAFKIDLEEELLIEAKKRAERQRLIRTFGLIGGGILTVVMGIVGVILLKRHNHEEDGEGPATGQAAPATAPVG